jgi:hypothetical protein
MNRLLISAFCFLLSAFTSSAAVVQNGGTANNLTLTGTAALPAASSVTFGGTAASALFQPVDSDLTAIAALSTTSFGRSVLAAANAGGLGTLISGGTGTLNLSGYTVTLPSSFVTLTGAQTMTNKTLTSPIIFGGSLSSPVITSATLGSGTFSGSISATSGTVFDFSAANSLALPPAIPMADPDSPGDGFSGTTPFAGWMAYPQSGFAGPAILDVFGNDVLDLGSDGGYYGGPFAQANFNDGLGNVVTLNPNGLVANFNGSACVLDSSYGGALTFDDGYGDSAIFAAGVAVFSSGGASTSYGQSGINFGGGASITDGGGGNLSISGNLGYITTYNITAYGTISCNGPIMANGTITSGPATCLGMIFSNSSATSGTINFPGPMWLATDETLYFSSASTISSLTVALPTASTSIVRRIVSKSAITSLTVTGTIHSGVTITSLLAGQCVIFMGDDSSGWVRIQ